MTIPTREKSTTQPYQYQRQELVEPDWRRIPGWTEVTNREWESAQWQRAHCIKSIRQLRAVMGDLLEERFYDDLLVDQATRATMSMLLPPQMLNTIAPTGPEQGETWTERWYRDPVRRYMVPVASDRRTDRPSHPYAVRDSLHEHDMWAVEGLTHRYPTKVLAELLPTCPQYCGHCTRMDLVGNSTNTVEKLRFELKPVDRTTQMLEYIQNTPQVRDVVVSGGDVANMPWPRLEEFLRSLLRIPTIRDIRLATKALAGMPQHWLQADVVAGLWKVASIAEREGVNLAIHTHVNTVQSVTPLVAQAARTALEVGVRDVRNQGVLLEGVNAIQEDILDLCFALQGEANILPYYLYMCDMIPSSEHWRVPLRRAQELQHAIMGYLPGYATPRIVCDVPYVGKRWVHQVQEYDQVRGVSYWTKNYLNPLEAGDPAGLTRRYEYYDPIHTLPPEGQEWWDEHTRRAA